MNFAKWVIAIWFSVAFIAQVSLAARTKSSAAEAVGSTLGSLVVNGVLIWLLVAYA